VAVATIVDYLGRLALPDTPETSPPAAALAGFRQQFYRCLTRRADALFELADAVLCTSGPVRSLAELSLTAEHRRGHGAGYDAINAGRVDVGRLRVTLAGLPLPRAADGRIVLAVDVSNWLRPDAPTSADRLFCHVYARGKGVPAENYVQAGQAACSYSWRRPPRRSRRWMFSWVSRPGSVIGLGSGLSGAALAMP
jgi:hypothetical protein